MIYSLLFPQYARKYNNLRNIALIFQAIDAIYYSCNIMYQLLEKCRLHIKANQGLVVV